MPVHVPQAGYQVAVAPVDDPGARRKRARTRYAQDLPILEGDGPVRLDRPVLDVHYRYVPDDDR